MAGNGLGRRVWRTWSGIYRLGTSRTWFVFRGPRHRIVFLHRQGLFPNFRRTFRDMGRGVCGFCGGVPLGFATATFGCFFFFSFLVSPSSFSRFEGFFFGGVVSPFTLSTEPHMSISQNLTRGMYTIVVLPFLFSWRGGLFAVRCLFSIFIRFFLLLLHFLLL